MTTAPLSVWHLLAVFGLGVGSLWWLAGCATRDRRLRWVILGSYSLRVALALALYTISYWQWPILRSMQLPHGFWKFAVDATVYHHHAPIILESWAEGVAWPPSQTGLQQYYFVFVPAVYRLVGYHPLYPTLVNCWFAACTGLFAYLIGRRLLDQHAALRGAVLVSFWPSSVLWSTQLLKDSLTWWAIFAALAVVVSATHRRGGLIRHAFLYLLLAGVTILVTCMRTYLGAFLSFAALAVFVPASGYALLRRQVGRSLRFAGIAAVIVYSMSFARTLDAYTLFSPRRPDLGHYAMGIQYWKSGELEQAEAAFREAIRFHQRHKEAYLALAALKIQAGAFDEALKAYTDCLNYVAPEDLTAQSRLKQLVGRVYVIMGDRHLAKGQAADAVKSYEQAVLFDPSLASAHANLGLALAQQRDFDRALASLKKAFTLVPPGEAEARPRLAAESERVTAEAERAKVVEAAGRGERAAGVAAPPPQLPLPSAPPPEPLFAKQSEETLVTLVKAQLPGQPFKSPEAPGVAKQPAGAQGEGDEFTGSTPPTAWHHHSVFDHLVWFSELIGGMRRGFIGSGGSSLIDSEISFSSVQDLFAYLPRALVVGFLAPFPGQWFDANGNTGIMRVFAGGEMVLVYLLVPALIYGMWRQVKRRRLENLFFVAFILIMAVMMSLVVANVGTLFRIRLFFFLPLLIVIAGGDPLGLYRRLLRWRGSAA